jgi:hypothetical protein
VLGVFRLWPLGYLNYLAGQRAEGAGKIALKSFAIATGLSGALGVPVLGSIYNQWMKAKGLDPEHEARKFLQEAVSDTKFSFLGGPRAADIALKGAPGALGLDLSRSLSPGDLMPEGTWESILGAPAAMIGNMGRAGLLLGQKFARPIGPEGYEALRYFGPGGIRSVMEAARLAQEGVQTGPGGAILTPEQVSPFDVMMRGAGVTTTKVGRARGEQRATQLALEYRNLETSRATEQLAKAMRDRDWTSFDAVIEKVRAHNEQMTAANRPERMLDITAEGIAEKYDQLVFPAARLRRLPREMRPGVLEEHEELYGLEAPQ